MATPTTQTDRFKPEMPRIPGVNEEVRPRRSALPKRTAQLIALAAAIVATLGGVAWYLHRSGARELPVAAAPESLPAASSPAPPPPLPSAPGPIATTEELAQPWTSKKFIFVRPDTHANVTAMVIRLPSVAGERSNSYWGFALSPPFGQCDLEYVTDVKQLADRYGYRATHPMLVAACSGTVYDPLRMGSIGSEVWARGEVVQGPGIRPPTAIRIQVTGHSVIADRIE